GQQSTIEEAKWRVCGVTQRRVARQVPRTKRSNAPNAARRLVVPPRLELIATALTASPVQARTQPETGALLAAPPPAPGEEGAEQLLPLGGVARTDSRVSTATNSFRCSSRTAFLPARMSSSE